MIRQELQDKLINDFPLLFKNNRFDGFWCPAGWYNLIYDLSAEIYKLLPEDSINKKYYVVQVKSKFSSLRYYMEAFTAEMDEFIQTAENVSYNICEACGKFKELKNINDDSNGNNLCFNCKIIKNIIE